MEFGLSLELVIFKKIIFKRVEKKNFYIQIRFS